MTASSAAAPGIRRNADIEEPSNLYLIHPLSARLLPLLQRLDVHPNTVSIAGGIAGVTAALVYYSGDGPFAAVAAFLCMLVWHVLDGADGQLARLTGKVTAFGFLIDGICDYIVFIAIYLVIGLTASATIGAGAWLLVGLAAVSHMIQAGAFEMQRSAYLHWTNPAKMMTAPSPSNPRTERLALPLRALAAAYQVMQRPFHPTDAHLQEQLASAARSGHAEAVARSYDEAYRSTVRQWALLSANQRTLVVFICFLAGQAIAYAWSEILLGNLILFLLMARNRRAAGRLALRLGFQPRL